MKSLAIKSPINGRRRTLALLPLMMLGACAAPRLDLASGVVFRRAGRFSLSVTHADDRQEAVQGGFLWADDGVRLELDLTDPVGAVLARVAVNQAGATLWHADGRREHAPDADTLVTRVLGGSVPVSGLRDWLQGQLQAGAADSVQHDEDGRLSAFEQQGWRVGLSRYDALGPTLLQLYRHDGQASVRVRLAITPAA